MFWGFLFLSIGAIILIQNIFGIDLPIVRIFFGLFLVYMGLKVVFGSFGGWSGEVKKRATHNEAVFSEAEFEFSKNFSSKNSNGGIDGDTKSTTAGSEKQSFHTVMASSKLDLSNIEMPNQTVIVEINNVLGQTKIISPKVPYQIRSKVVMGEVKIKNQSQGTLVGENTFKSPNFDSNTSAYIDIVVNNVLGAVIFE